MDIYKALSVFILLYLPMQASALDKNATYNQTTVAYFQLDAQSEQTIELNSNILISKNVYLIANIDNRILDPRSANTERIEAGAGYRYQINALFDINAAVFYQQQISQDPAQEKQSNQIGFEAGTRVTLNTDIALYSAIVYKSAERTQDDNEISLKLQGQYYFTPNISAGLQAEILDTNNIYALQGVFHF